MAMTVYHEYWNKGLKCRKSTMREYHRHESSMAVITHTQIFNGKLLLFLKTYGLDSWTIEIPMESK